MKTPKELTVLIDRREKRPLLFPPGFWWVQPGNGTHYIRIQTKIKTLPTGDYVLDKYESISALERKGSWSEIHTNVNTKDMRRFNRCLDRLIESVLYPWILLDFPIVQGKRVSGIDRTQEWNAHDKLTRMCMQKNIPIFWWPCKTQNIRIETGTAVVRRLWTITYEYLTREGAKCQS